MTEGFWLRSSDEHWLCARNVPSLAYAVHWLGCIPPSSYTFSLNRIWIV